jgi:hypothetical protein
VHTAGYFVKKPGTLTEGSYQILKYLIRHPQAQDTVEGIVEWWLLEQRIVDAAAGVKLALAELTAKAFVKPRHTWDGRTYYRLNPGKKKRIEAMLETLKR